MTALLKVGPLSGSTAHCFTQGFNNWIFGSDRRQIKGLACFWTVHVMCCQRVKMSDRPAESLIPRILMTHQCYIARTLMTPGQLWKTTNNPRKCENTNQHLAELKAGVGAIHHGASRQHELKGLAAALWVPLLLLVALGYTLLLYFSISLVWSTLLLPCIRLYLFVLRYLHYMFSSCKFQFCFVHL